MKNVVIKQLFVVGMYYYGGRELFIDILMFCFLELINKWDLKVVVIYYDREMLFKVVYLKRLDVVVVFKFFQKGIISGFCYFKVKGFIEKIIKRIELQ